jgi:ethanolamine ammonia-lyase small subunit
MSSKDVRTTVTADPWDRLRQVTSARIAVGRAGGSTPTHEWLNFKSAHAAARDAVHSPFDAEQLAAEIQSLGVATVTVRSKAADRREFLERPDLGRRLCEESRSQLQSLRTDPAADLAIVVSDGLSAVAAHRQSTPLVAALLPKLGNDWRLAPIVVASLGRVALEDDVGQLLGVQLVLMLIGERPGLGSPDSLGAYLVFNPRVGNTDAHRNCVSNIRPEGLSHDAAADTILYLLNEARRRKLSGVQLKDQRSLSADRRPLA